MGKDKLLRAEVLLDLMEIDLDEALQIYQTLEQLNNYTIEHGTKKEKGVALSLYLAFQKIIQLTEDFDILAGSSVDS